MQEIRPAARIAPPPPPALTAPFWLRHLALPLCAFLPLAALLAVTDTDRRLSLAWAFDAVSGSFPARNAYWAQTVLHEGGRDFVWLIVLLCAGLLAASASRPALREWRRPLVFTVVAIGITTAFIGALKQVTQVYCPWDLQGFGGIAAYTHLFAERVAQVNAGACFPGAHSGSGFALFALYFALRDRKPGLALAALVLALFTGALFAFGQEARGAHFLSHDLWSAAIAWFVCLSLYRLGLQRDGASSLHRTITSDPTTTLSLSSGASCNTRK